MNLQAIDTAAVQKLVDKGATDYPGMIVQVREGGRDWIGSAGVADVGTGQERLPQQQFRVGSITKTFTATLVLQLAAEYALSLDDTVEKWLPGLVRGNGHDGNRITVRHLLSHTSGLFAFTLDEELMRRYMGPGLLEHRFDRWTPEELVKISLSHAPEFEPGEGWSYSNTNFVLAGMILERASGMTYAELVEHRIARPLKLTGTYAPGHETGYRDRYVHGYTRLMRPEADAPSHDVSEQNASYGAAVGELISTTEDLTAFLGALLAGRLLPPAQMAEMFTMTPVPDGKWLDGYGYGLGISSVKLANGTTVHGHGGMIAGNWSYLYGTLGGERVTAQHVNGDWGCPPLDLFPEVLEAVFAPAAGGPVTA
ncbi:serine hydrolase domain-containing protein [Streptomyces sp. MS1.HAVA.3]|uniref:Serine hydrolase domain-containing protein n=1 Tax=Streptomyces caledonius TaxID=3134107 RepID=A0ABU8U9Q2_9ACTN